jgi:thymidine kinase
MFVEPFLQPSFERSPLKSAGWIEVICGCMFSGKTEELIRRLKRADIAKQKVGIFKPSMDTRYHLENVVSHNQNSIPSLPVKSSKEMVLTAIDYDVVGIDEGQFFDNSLAEVCGFLANMGKRVIVAGLDMDYSAKPFGNMSELMSTAEFITKVHAICVVCGSVASYSYRLAANSERVLLGESDVYEARCRQCFQESSVRSDVPDGYES